MIRTILLFSVCALALASGSPRLHAAILFDDTFNRSPAGTSLADIDSNTTGITAAFALPSVVYVERDEYLAGPLGGGPQDQATADVLTKVENDRLQLATAGNSSVLHVNHNFAEPGITNLKASFDVVSNNGTAEENNQRWVGIGFGATQAEAEAARYDFNNSTAPGWKGHQNGTTVGSGFADFFVAWERSLTTADNLGKVVVYRNGIRGTAFPATGVATFVQGGKLEVDLSFSDFNTGSTVSAQVSYGGVLLGTENFTWGNTNANYIGVTARQGGGWTIDNLRIETSTVPEPSSLSLAAALAALCGRARRAGKNRMS